MTIQFALAWSEIATVQCALKIQIDLLQTGTPFRQVLDEMIAEQQQPEDSPDDCDHGEDGCLHWSQYV